MSPPGPGQVKWAIYRVSQKKWLSECCWNHCAFAPKSYPWENLALQHSILVRIFGLQQHSESHFFGAPYKGQRNLTGDIRKFAATIPTKSIFVIPNKKSTLWLNMKTRYLRPQRHETPKPGVLRDHSPLLRHHRVFHHLGVFQEGEHPQQHLEIGRCELFFLSFFFFNICVVYSAE